MPQKKRIHNNSYSDNLTLSRIHTLLRPYETKLNALIRALHDRKVTASQYLPHQRQRGVTYRRRHKLRDEKFRLRARGLNAVQAGRVERVEKDRGIASCFGLEELVVAVEESFRNLVRACTCSTDDKEVERVPTLQTMISKMIGRQVAEESLRDKEELEEEGLDDVIGIWYNDLTSQCRKDALIAHALEFLILKTPIFIIELWKGLLAICLEHHLLEESNLLLEDILLYHLTPLSNFDESNNATKGRDLTDLYTLWTTHLPPGEFFALLLPILETSPPATWDLRAVQHLIRHIDNDVILTCQTIQRMAACVCFSLTTQGPSTASTSVSIPSDIKGTTKNVREDFDYLLRQIQPKSFTLLGDLLSSATLLETETARSYVSLSWSLWVLGQRLRGYHLKRVPQDETPNDRPAEHELISGLALAFDIHLLSLSSAYIDKSDLLERLLNPKLVRPIAPSSSSFPSTSSPPSGDYILEALITALRLFNSRSSEQLDGDERIEQYSTLLEKEGLHALAGRLRAAYQDSHGKPVHLRYTLRNALSKGVGSKRKADGEYGRNRSFKKARRKSDDESESSDDGSDHWQCSSTEEDTAGERSLSSSSESESPSLSDEDGASREAGYRQRQMAKEEKGHHDRYISPVENRSPPLGLRRKLPNSDDEEMSGMYGQHTLYRTDEDELEEDEQQSEQMDGSELTREQSEEEEEPSQATGINGILRLSNHAFTSIPRPVLQSVLNEKLKGSLSQSDKSLKSRTSAKVYSARNHRLPPLHRFERNRKSETSHSSEELEDSFDDRESRRRRTMPSSDDDLDLLGRDSSS